MCYYNGINVTEEEYGQWVKLERPLAFLNEEFAIHKGTSGSCEPDSFHISLQIT